MKSSSEKAGTRWLLERKRPSRDRPSHVQRSDSHRRPYNIQPMSPAEKETAYLSLRPNFVNHGFDPSCPPSASHTVCTIADLPTPGAPLIHMISFSAHSPFRQIQFVTTSCAALRVSAWHRGAGYRSLALRNASKATQDSSVSGLPPDVENRDIDHPKEMMLTLLNSLGMSDVGGIRVPDDVQISTCSVAIANVSDGFLGHE